MGKKIKETWMYWKMVFGEILPFIGGEMKPYIIGVIIALIISCGSTFGFLFGWLPTGWVDTTWEQSAYSILSAVVFVGLLFLVALFVLAYIPAKIHNKQSADIKDLQEQLGKPVTNQGLEISPYIEFGSHKVGIKIHNSTFENTSNLKVEMINLLNVPYFTGNKFPSHSLMFHIEEVNRTFNETKRLNKHGGIDKQGHAFVYLMEVINNDVLDNAPVFLLEKRFPYSEYEQVRESEKSIDSKRQEEVSYTGYKNFALSFEIELLITAEKINSGQLIEKQFKGRIDFLEMVREWIKWGDKWTRIGDKPVAEISLDIVEVANEKNPA